MVKKIPEKTEDFNGEELEFMRGTMDHLDYIILGNKGGLRCGFKPVVESTGSIVLIGARVRVAPDGTIDFVDVAHAIKSVYPDIKFQKLDNLADRGSCFFGISVPAPYSEGAAFTKAMVGSDFINKLVEECFSIIEQTECCEYRKKLLIEYTNKVYLEKLTDLFGLNTAMLESVGKPALDNMVNLMEYKKHLGEKVPSEVAQIEHVEEVDAEMSEDADTPVESEGECNEE